MRSYHKSQPPKYNNEQTSDHYSFVFQLLRQFYEQLFINYRIHVIAQQVKNEPVTKPEMLYNSTNNFPVDVTELSHDECDSERCE